MQKRVTGSYDHTIKHKKRHGLVYSHNMIMDMTKCHDQCFHNHIMATGDIHNHHVCNAVLFKDKRHDGHQPV